MFGKLPELFERNFAIGYFLPVVAFIIATLWLFDIAGMPVADLTVDVVNQIDALVGGIMIGLVSWLSSVFLLVVNRDLLRFMEGYGQFNPARLLAFLESKGIRNYKRTSKRSKTNIVTVWRMEGSLSHQRRSKN
jgi:hypothetical protein